jgi:branched-chain amino acid transport system substrate-binding protein
LSTSEASDDGGPIVIGLAVADSGPIAPYDIEAVQAVELAAEQINERGGIKGREIKLVKRDTASDKAQAANVATELIDEGAVAIIASCDFDYGSPAAISAQARNVPGISMCASDPKFADRTTIGEYAFTLGVGSDYEATSNAEWSYKRGWRSVYILQDESIEYTKALGRYFEARWAELGGTIAGRESFAGGENVNVRPHASKIARVSPAPDFIYLPSWNPGAASAIRQLRANGVELPIVGPAALDSAAFSKIAGNVSGVYFSPYACYAYCSGQDEPALQEFAKAFEERWGKAPSSSYDISAYNVMLALAAGMERASEITGPALQDALEQLPPIDTPVGKVQFFSPTCNKPIDAPLSYVEAKRGALVFVEQHRPEAIPNLDDGNPCSAE